MQATTSTETGQRFALGPGSDMQQRFFLNRREAGRMPAHALLPLKDAHPVVLALPRGGVPVGYEIARFLGAPLQVFIVRKIGVPGHRELAMGALAFSRLLQHSTFLREHAPQIAEMLPPAADVAQTSRRKDGSNWPIYQMPQLRSDVATDR